MNRVKTEAPSRRAFTIAALGLAANAGCASVSQPAVAQVPVTNVAPEKHKLSVADLPKPNATPSVRNESHLVTRPEGATLNVPPGFTVKEWCTNLDNPRVIHVAPNGDVFVVESGPGRVRLLRDKDGDGNPETRTIFAQGLTQPFGLAFYPTGPNPEYVYIANTNSVIHYKYHNGDMTVSGVPETIVSDLPGGGYNQHWTRNIVVRPDNPEDPGLGRLQAERRNRAGRKAGRHPRIQSGRNRLSHFRFGDSQSCRSGLQPHRQIPVDCRERAG